MPMRSSAAACSFGDPAFGLSQVVWAEVGHVTKLLLTEVLLPAKIPHVASESANQRSRQAFCPRCGHGLPSLDTPRHSTILRTQSAGSALVEQVLAWASKCWRDVAARCGSRSERRPDVPQPGEAGQVDQRLAEQQHA
jgi:hypothetical protein